jgi:hypothetical protein
MNQQDKIVLSKRVAEKYGIETYDKVYEHKNGEMFWLADDDARCFRLAVQANMDILFGAGVVMTRGKNDGELATEWFKNHDDAYDATRIAILKCLEVMKG